MNLLVSFTSHFCFYYFVAYMADLFKSLLLVVDRKDASKSNRVGAFEVISMLIQNAAPDVKPFLLQLLSEIIARLANSFELPALTDEDAQGQLCGLIQVLSIKLSREELALHCDEIMKNFIQVMRPIISRVMRRHLVQLRLLHTSLRVTSVDIWKHCSHTCWQGCSTLRRTMYAKSRLDFWEIFVVLSRLRFHLSVLKS